MIRTLQKYTLAEITSHTYFFRLKLISSNNRATTLLLLSYVNAVLSAFMSALPKGPYSLFYLQTFFGKQ